MIALRRGGLRKKREEEIGRRPHCQAKAKWILHMMQLEEPEIAGELRREGDDTRYIAYYNTTKPDNPIDGPLLPWNRAAESRSQLDACLAPRITNRVYG